MATKNEIRIYAADIGSVKRGRFGWACSHRRGGRNIRDLVAALVVDLSAGRAIALGLECPLWVPVAIEPDDLTLARSGEGSRPWSASAGCTVLATGLVEAAWILAELKSSGVAASLHLDWSSFQEATGPRLLLWEAFVSGASKGVLHEDDAQIAVKAFKSALPDPTKNRWCTPPPRVFSMIGGAMLHAGWTTDLRFLSLPCLVIGDRVIARSRRA